MRYRLVPTRNQGARSCYVDGDEFDAREAARAAHAQSGIPVLLVEAPEGGLVRQVGLVGADPRKVKR